MNEHTSSHTSQFASPATADSNRPWSAELIGLYRSAYRGLVSLAQRIVCDRALAEDCVQEAFMAFHAKGIETGPGAERAYLRSMVRNGAISRVRKESRGHEYVRSCVEKSVDSAEALALANLEAIDLAAGVARLPVRQSEVVSLSLAGMSVGETADVLEISPGTVKTHRHRAAAALRVSLSSGFAS